MGVGGWLDVAAAGDVGLGHGLLGPTGRRQSLPPMLTNRSLASSDTPIIWRGGGRGGDDGKGKAAVVYPMKRYLVRCMVTWFLADGERAVGVQLDDGAPTTTTRRAPGAGRGWWQENLSCSNTGRWWWRAQQGRLVTSLEEAARAGGCWGWQGRSCG